MCGSRTITFDLMSIRNPSVEQSEEMSSSERQRYAKGRKGKRRARERQKLAKRISQKKFDSIDAESWIKFLGSVDLFLSFQTSRRIGVVVDWLDKCLSVICEPISTLSLPSLMLLSFHWHKRDSHFSFLISLPFWPSLLSHSMFDVVITKWLTMKRREKRRKRKSENETNIVFHSNSAKKYNKKEFAKQHQQLRSVFSSPRQKRWAVDNGLHTHEDKWVRSGDASVFFDLN